jgi:hypothetical protein
MPVSGSANSRISAVIFMKNYYSEDLTEACSLNIFFCSTLDDMIAL